MKDALEFIPVLTALVAVIALALSLKGSKRTDKQDVAKDAEQTARIETKLDSVRAGVDDIRVDMRTQQRQINDHETRLTRIETRQELKGE